MEGSTYIDLPKKIVYLHNCIILIYIIVEMLLKYNSHLEL